MTADERERLGRVVWDNFAHGPRMVPWEGIPPHTREDFCRQAEAVARAVLERVIEDLAAEALREDAVGLESAALALGDFAEGLRRRLDAPAEGRADG